MSPMQDLLIATRALRANKLRSALTALGLVVGVSAVVCMVSLGAGARAEVSETMRTLGANLLLIWPGAQTNSLPFADAVTARLATYSLSTVSGASLTCALIRVRT